MALNASRAAVVLAFLALLPCGPGSASELSAIVLAQDASAPVQGRSTCAGGLEGVLRQLGFRVLDSRSDPCKADLLVQIIIHPVERIEPATRRGFSIRAEMEVFRPQGQAGEGACQGQIRGQRMGRFQSVGESYGSESAAMADACRQIERQMRDLIERRMGELLAEPTTMTITLRWTERLEPMPLIKLSSFFKTELGLVPDLVSSDDQHCRYSFIIDDPMGQLESRLQDFLSRFYEIRACSRGPSKIRRSLDYLLAPKRPSTQAPTRPAAHPSSGP
ncbi:MAG: hypothetical protein JXR96_21590 [Deltaproteobacteria bacterium]|nr:hypothetical protein [Deltaproteobacteria bacterium]